MKRLALVGLLFLCGCDAEQPTPVVAPQAPSATAQLSGVSAAVAQARSDNEQNPSGLPKDAVGLQLSIAAAGLPTADPTDAAKAAETSALVFAGRIEEATRRATTAEMELARLRELAEKERADGKARLDRVIADAESRVRAAEGKAEKEAYLRVVSIFALLGAAIALVGIACAVTGWSRVGVLCIPAGIAIGGSGLLFGKPWFIWTLGIGIALCCIASGVVWAVRVIESRRAPAAIPSVSGPTPSG